MTSNLELQAIIKHDDLLSDYYNPNISRENFRIENLDFYWQIINLDKDVNQGTHWVMFIKMKHRIVYIDSFGLEPFENLVKECKRLGIELFYRTKRDQFDDWTCGIRVLRYIYAFEIGEFKTNVTDLQPLDN